MKTLALLALAAAALGVAGPAGAADLAHGKKVFVTCGYCHGVNGLGGSVGPTLKGVSGRQAGAVPGFAYSTALKTSGLKWTDANLSEFLAAPKVKVKGNRMIFPGLKNKADLDDVVAYIKTIK